MTISLFHRHDNPPELIEARRSFARSLIAPVDDRIAELEDAFRYIHVTVDTHFVPEDCRCGEGTTCVRVYGDESAVPDVTDVLVEEEVCHACGLGPDGPIVKAGYQSRSDRDIRVEVCA